MLGLSLEELLRGSKRLLLEQGMVRPRDEGGRLGRDFFSGERRGEDAEPTVWPLP